MVFASLVPSDQVFIKVAGVGLVAAILVDATVIRMLLVQAIMHLLGRSNWWLPRGMARRLPQLHIEGPPITSGRPSVTWNPAPPGESAVGSNERRNSKSMQP